MNQVPPPPDASTSPAIHHLGEVVQQEMERLSVPGVSLGVLNQGDELYASFGITSVENPLPVDEDTLFQIGSTTKTATATAAMRLVEDGSLNLDAPLRRFLPDLRLSDEETARLVTLRHLLTHTGGWVGDYFADFGFGDDALAKMVSHLAELPQLAPLGTLFSYNNAGFYLAGRLVEAIRGVCYEEATKTLVLDPLGMTASCFFPTEVITRRFAVGHIVEEGRPHIAHEWSVGRAAHPIGGLVSSARDQLRYARFHLGDGTGLRGDRLLSPESMAAMQTPQVEVGGEIDAVGLSWMLKSAGGERVVFHGGATNGQLSAFVLVPERGFAITVLTNASTGRELQRLVTDEALHAFLGLERSAPQPVDRPLESLEPYCGRYTAALQDLTLTVDGGRMTLKVQPKGGFPKRDSPPMPAPPPAPLAFHGDDQVIVTEGPMNGTRGTFLRDADGEITWFRFALRCYAREP